MAVFNNLTKSSPIASVEFSPVSDGNFAFFYLNSPDSIDSVKKWLDEIGQEYIAQTTVHGHTTLITKGRKSQEHIKSLMIARGDQLELFHVKKPINYWALRGGMSVVGQTLQLTSALVQAEKVTLQSPQLNSQSPLYNPHVKEGMWIRKGFSADIGVFAILNLIANGANIIYGGQSEKDGNRLKYVKGKINDKLAPELKDGQQPIDVNDKRSTRHFDPAQPLGIIDKANEFARRNSVRFFELGLRFAAAMALVFPYNKWKTGRELLGKGQLGQAFKESLNPNRGLLAAGTLYLTGKTIALFAKVPDPYDTKKHTTLDTIREKILFNTGSVTELVAGSIVGINAFQTKKVGMVNKESAGITPHRDWFGTVGGGLFAAGYAVRLGAKFGTKNINMDEVYAHAEDMLAKTPEEKIPQLLAETAAELTNHFTDKNMNFGEAYTHMMADMYRFNHVALNSMTPSKSAKTSPDEVNQIAAGEQPEAPSHSQRVEKRSPATITKKSLDQWVKPPEDTHAKAEELARAASQQMITGLGT